MSLCDGVRRAAAEVSRRARFVHIDAARLEALAARLAKESTQTPDYDIEHHHRGSPASTLAFSLTLDSINFGSVPLRRNLLGRDLYSTKILHTAFATRYETQTASTG